MRNLFCKKGIVRVGNKVIPNRNPPRPNPPNFRPGRPPISTRPGVNPPPVAVPYPNGTIAPERKPFTVNAGPIWNQKEMRVTKEHAQKILDEMIGWAKDL